MGEANGKGETKWGGERQKSLKTEKRVYNAPTKVTLADASDVEVELSVLLKSSPLGASEADPPVDASDAKP